MFRPTLLRIAAVIACAIVAGYGQGLRFESPYIAGFHPLDEGPSAASPLNARKPVILKLNTTMFSDTSQIDFEKRQITFRRVDPLGYIMWEFHYGELSDYLASRRHSAFNLSWEKEMAMLKPAGADAADKGMKLEWELPVQYPSWAQRVLGKEPPKLSLDGFLEITMGWANTKYDENIPTQQNRPNNAFNFDINYQFTITGSVGRLININITADKEQNFDISNNLKNFKIEYKEATPGELEDEIIQEVILGYTGFSMPGTNLSGYSESHEGLFGVKIRSRLGPLELTMIASTEQGQSNKKTYSSSGTADKAVFMAKDYQKDRYFFLDNVYRKYYQQKYNINNPVAKPVAPPKVKTLSVWRSFDRSSTDKKSNIRTVRVDTTDQTYLYERLERDKHYYLDDAEGYIRFTDSIQLQPQQQVAIFMRTDDSGAVEYAQLQKGEMKDTAVIDSATGATVLDTIWTLWTIRPMTPILSAGADTSRFYLMWRNVYGPANFSDPTSFKLSVERIDQVNGERLDKEGSLFYADLLGLSSNNTPKVQDVVIYNKLFNDLILPPFDTTEDGFEPFNNPALEEFRDSVIYRYAETHPKRMENEGYKSIYEISMSGSQKKTTFDDLGWGIMEGTERVVADGVKLERDRDYTISYDMGMIDLISARAKAAQKVEIEYQSEALFVPDKKMFFGTHGRVDLPFLSDKSYAGASFLFQSTRSNEDIPRLDQEPFNKMLFDINTHIEFEPEWMTGLVNALPLVNTEASSSVALDFEIAHSRVNPNKSGSAYIDDFEDSKQSDMLSNGDKSWFLASPPVHGDSLPKYPPAWDIFWFSPKQQDVAHRVKRDEIIVLSEEEKKQSTLGADYESVLRLHVKPAPSDNTLQDRFKKAWAGIMTPISQSFADKKQAQFFEFFVRTGDGRFDRKGKLRFQMGEMREDISLNGGKPNNRADREDTAQLIQTQTWDQNLDLGWDRLSDSSEVYLIPSSDGGKWDTLRYRDRLLGVDSLDPAKDNWKDYDNQRKETMDNFRYACRRQMDGDIELSEDINFDGAVQTAITEKYFQFTIDLDDAASPFIDTTVKYATPGLWRKYRIPLHERISGYESVFDSINGPTWSNITMVRLIWTDFDSAQLDKENSLVLYNMEFVGNQWIEVADSSRIKIRSSVVNTREDKDYEEYWKKYKNLINRERDEYGYEIEQSLRLNFINLVPGDSALVEKNLQFQTLNLSAYQRLSLLVFGMPPPGAPPPPAGEPLYGGDVRFVFRFGTDDSTYYEYSREIMPEWNNSISIDLRELSALKDAYMVGHRDSAVDTSNGVLRVRAPRGRQPNFSRIQWMALGVVRGDAAGGNDSLSGEIWVNEMKLTGIRDINGTASRVDLSTKFADLLSFQAKMEYENGNFRRMTETQNIPDNTQMNGSMGASIALERFLPSAWGLMLPAGVTYNSSILRPQLKNETDVFLVDKKTGDPDGLLDVVKDAATAMVGVGQKNDAMTAAEYYQTSNVGRTYYTGYKKTNHDENPIVNLLADRWSADARYSTTISETRYGQNPDDNTLFTKRDTSDVYSGKVQYELTPYNPPEWLKWAPFKSAEQKWFPSRMKSYELTLLPQTFTIDVADISFGKQRQEDTWRGVPHYQQNNFTVRHNVTLNHTPLSPLCDMQYTLGINRDLIRAASDDNLEKGKKIFSRDHDWKDYWVSWGEKDRHQHAGINLNPKFFEWLTTSGEYSSDYDASTVQWLREPQPYLNTGVKSALSLNGSISFDQILGDLKKATEKNALGGLVDMIKKGFDQIGLRQISLTYKAGSSLKNNYVSTGLLGSEGIYGIKDLLLYQLGVKGRSPLDILTGEMDDRHFLGMRSRGWDDDNENSDLYRNDSRTVDRSLQVSSGIEIKPLDLSFRTISLNRSINYNIYPDSTRNDTTITFPDLSVNFSTQILNRIEFVKTELQSVGVTSTFTYRSSDRLTTKEVAGSSRSVKYDLMPLISLSGTLKRWPVNFSYRHNFSREINTVLSEKAVPTDTNKNAKMHADEVTISYEIDRNSKLSEIKLLMWTIPIKGKTTLGLTFNRTSDKETVEARNDENYSLIPKLSYIFTDNVTGRMEYTFRRHNDRGKVTTTNDFAVILRVGF